jgi:hypothetical protein
MINSENNQNLRRVALHAVFYQILSVIILGFLTTLGFMFDQPILSLIGFIIIGIYSFFILKILIFDENPCPNCHAPFFKRKGSLSNLGFSIYSKKCTNCKFKI